MESDKVAAKLATLETQNKFILQNLQELNKKVEQLTLFKMKVIGAGAAFGAMGAIIIEAVKGYLIK